jgi:hypothetical protein
MEMLLDDTDVERAKRRRLADGERQPFTPALMPARLIL